MHFVLRLYNGIVWTNYDGEQNDQTGCGRTQAFPRLLCMVYLKSLYPFHWWLFLSWTANLVYANYISDFIRHLVWSGAFCNTINFRYGVALLIRCVTLLAQASDSFGRSLLFLVSYGHISSCCLLPHQHSTKAYALSTFLVALPCSRYMGTNESCTSFRQCCFLQQRLWQVQGALGLSKWQTMFTDKWCENDLLTSCTVLERFCFGSSFGRPWQNLKQTFNEHIFKSCDKIWRRIWYLLLYFSLFKEWNYNNSNCE